MHVVTFTLVALTAYATPVLLTADGLGDGDWSDGDWSDDVPPDSGGESEENVSAGT